MLVKLHNSFQELPDRELRDHFVMLQSLLHLHIERRILLLISPKLINRLVDDTEIGVVNRRILEAISKRSQEYNAVAKRCRRIAVIHPDSAPIIPITSADRLEGHGSRMIRFLSVTPRLYVENSNNDGRFYKFLFGSVARAGRWRII